MTADVRAALLLAQDALSKGALNILRCDALDVISAILDGEKLTEAKQKSTVTIEAELLDELVGEYTLARGHDPDGYEWHTETHCRVCKLLARVKAARERG